MVKLRKMALGPALVLLMAFPVDAQQFSTPIDLVETLYNSYFIGMAIDDFAPYLSDDLTRQIDGKVGTAEFRVLGFDPIVGESNWSPRHFIAELVEQTTDHAKVRVDFFTNGMPVSVTFTLVHERLHGWQIDHISGTSGRRTWCTNDIIALRPAAKN